MKVKKRCLWAEKEVFHSYHDREWGCHSSDDKEHFELLCLEGAQAGLSWETVLRKREAYRKAFKNFDPKLCSKLSESFLQKQLQNPGIIRNKLKVYSIPRNAKVFLEIQKEFGSFHAYIWSFVAGKQIDMAYQNNSDIPTQIPESHALSANLKKRGMTFVGPTIMYAHMQSAGLVNDHTLNCFCYKACSYKKILRENSSLN